MSETPPPVDLKVPQEHHARLRQLVEARDRAQTRKVFRSNRAAQYLQKGWFEFRYYQLMKEATEADMAFTRAQANFVNFLNAILPDTLVGEWLLYSDTMTISRQQRPRSIFDVITGGR